MPPLSVFFGSWSFDPWALALLLAAGGVYGVGLVRATRNGTRPPLWRILSFYLLGLGSYAAINFGFLGTYSPELRWAFSIRIALMLFVVPSGLALGLPVGLARNTMRPGRLRAVLTKWGRWPMKFFSNTAVAPVVGLIVLSVFLTPMAGVMRMSSWMEGSLTILIPLLGLLLIVPITEERTRTSSALIMLQFVFAFIELLADAIPGIVLRINDHVLDGVAFATGAHPGWFPNPLRDQQIAGDWLWFIAEAADLPIMIMLFVRFSKTDKGERKVLDEMSDDEMDALNSAHLNMRG